MIEIKNLQVKYDKTFHNPEVIAINNLSICLERGQFHVIIGQSGSGKTSLLRAIAGLTNHTGSIFVDGIDFDNIHPSDRNIAYVSQNYALYPHMTVFDNIAFPLKTRGASKKEIVDTVYEASKMLDIDYLLNRKPKELSGGQQQRVALARALVKKPEIYLFDEPLSNVSLEARDKERNLIREIVKKYQSTAIYATHNINEATSLADKIVVMNEGEIVFVGTPIETLKSDNPYVQELLRAELND